MAGREQYGGHASANPYYDTAYNNQYTQAYDVSPTEYSRYDNRPYYSNHSQSYNTTAGRSDDTEAYDDRHGIPLDQRRKAESTTSVAPIIQDVAADDDPFIRDAKPGRRKGRRGRDDDGWFRGKITWACFVLSVAQLIVFIAELVRNGVLTGTPIQTQPSFNPMLGPSPYVLINMGARYQPCMHNMPNVQNASTIISWPCPNATATTGASVTCSLSDLCGNGGVPNPRPGGSITDSPSPNQWWRFIVPIFLHAGIIHIGFNLLLQLTLGREIEKLIGTIRFIVVYFAAGIFGFVLGGNFAANGIASTGCSGSLFGILAITLLDLLYTWSTRSSPVKDLLFIILDIAIAFVLGLLPGLDNFSHIGGFLMGLVLGVCLLRSPVAISQRTSQIYDTSPLASKKDDGIVAFVRQPVGFFKNRKPVWWVWWCVRLAALVGVLIGFILLLQNFYVWGTSCGWCIYLSCLPVEVSGVNWCKVGNLQFTSTTPNKRSLLSLGLV